MVAFDAGMLSLVIFPNAGIPVDPKTGKTTERAKERVEALIDELESDGDTILIPAPALCEALVSVADQMGEGTRVRYKAE